MGDSFCEVLVEKKTTSKDKFLKGLMIFGTVILFLAGVLIHPICMLLAIGMGIFTYIYAPRFNVEFEYAYINGQLDIDRIFSKQKRKRFASYDLSKMEIFAPVNSHRLDYYKSNPSLKIVDCSSGEEQGHHPFAFLIAGEKGTEMVCIEPSAEMLKDMKNRFPRKVFAD